MEQPTRRTVIHAAWSVPVVAAAISVPQAAASGSDKPAVCGLYHSSGNNGTYHVYPDRIEIYYDTAPDIYEANVRHADGSTSSHGTNYGTAPSAGSTVWVIPLRSPASWVQVHTFNDHYGEVC